MKYLLVCLFIAGALAAPSRRLPIKRPKGAGGIVGGTDATAGQFPYIVDYDNTAFGIEFQFCAASIYSTTWAISAGHCVEGDNYNNPQNREIIAGDLTHSVESGDEQRRVIIKIVPHPDFNSANLENDISLLQMESPLTFNSMVAAIPIPATGQTFADGTLCEILGWGSLSYGTGEYPDVLQWTQVPILSDQVCRDDYLLQIFDSNICAGDNGKDTCQGDSGGPMECNGFLAGIVSWGHACASPGYPGIYTEVSYFVDFITSNAV